MFERFTDRARRVVVQAQEEARVLNHNYIGTEHILLGLIREGEGVAARALESLGISLEAVRQQVEDIIRRGQQAPSGHVPFTPRAKKVLQLSLREALQLGHAYIGTEHILLGLVREGEGVAAQVLVKLGADMNRVRQEVIQLLHGYPAGGAEAGRAEARTWPPRLEGHAEQLDEIIGRLDSIAGRLAAIERRLGILDEPKPPQDRKTAGEPEPTAGDTGIVAVTEEAAGLRGEVGRLQALLRQHGIEPDDGGPDDSEPDDSEPDVGEPDDGQPQAGRPGR